MLEFQTFGEGSAQQLVIAHGLYGSGRNWRAIAKRLSRDFRVITVDMRNHAGSFWSNSMRYEDMADDLAEVITANGGRAMVMGHSMGGKASMVLALKSPELVERLVVADIAPVAYAHSQAQYADAMMDLDLIGIASRGEADARLAGSVDDPSMRAFMLQSLDLTDDSPRWMLNLEVLKREMPGIVGFPKVSGSFDGTTLFVTGAQSDYVQAKDRPLIKALFPSARFAKIKGAGHWLHADQPRAFIEIIQGFCSRD